MDDWMMALGEGVDRLVTADLAFRLASLLRSLVGNARTTVW